MSPTSTGEQTTTPLANGDAVRAWLSAWLTEEYDALLDVIVDRTMAELPELTFAPDRPEVHIRDAIDSHLCSLRDTLTQAHPAEQVILPLVFDDYTRRLARTETPPLPVLLRSFEEFHARLWDALVTAVRSGPRQVEPTQRAEIMELASARLFRYFHSVAAQTSRAYAAERALHERRDTAARHDVVMRVIAGSLPPHEAERLLGYQLNTVHVAYEATFDTPGRVDRLASVLRQLGGRIGARHHLSVSQGADGGYGWMSPVREDWRRSLDGLVLPAGVRLSLGAPHEGLVGFRRGRDEASEAMRIAEIDGRSGVTLFDDVAYLSLATRDLASARAFVERGLGRLFAGDESTVRLWQTLRVYLEELASPTRTARRLFVHPNTVVKRLERIEEYLGGPIDPASVNLRLAVELAPFVRGA